MAESHDQSNLPMESDSHDRKNELDIENREESDIKIKGTVDDEVSHTKPSHLVCSEVIQSINARFDDDPFSRKVLRPTSSIDVLKEHCMKPSLLDLSRQITELQNNSTNITATQVLDSISKDRRKKEPQNIMASCGGCKAISCRIM